MSKRAKPVVVKLTKMQAQAVWEILQDTLQPERQIKPWKKTFPYEWAKMTNIAWKAMQKIEFAIWPED
jgi:hypothetical protein